MLLYVICCMLFLIVYNNISFHCLQNYNEFYFLQMKDNMSIVIKCELFLFTLRLLLYFDIVVGKPHRECFSLEISWLYSYKQINLWEEYIFYFWFYVFILCYNSWRIYLLFILTRTKMKEGASFYLFLSGDLTLGLQQMRDMESHYHRTDPIHQVR